MASYWGEVEIIQNWQSIEGNYTNVTANYYACADSYAGWSNYTTYPFLGLYHGADKTEESQTLTSFDFRKNKRILIGSITKNIPHNADGTMSVSASFTWDSDHSMVGTLTGYASKTLSTIPRASSITATDANIGSASIININTASSGFTHTVEYIFSGLTGRIATKTSQTSIGWSVPTSFFEKIPNAQSGTVTITCYTYSGNTHIGTKTTTMTVSVPTSGTYNSMPVIDSATAVDTNDTTIALTKDSSRLVTYFSNVKVNVTGRCLNYAGFSKLRERNVIDIPATTTTSNGTTNVTGEKIFEKNTSIEFRIVLVDTRQLASSYKYLNEANGDFKVVPYIPLTMSVNAERVSPTSASIKLNFSGNFYNGYYDEAKSNFNDVIIRWRHKLRDSNNWILDGADDTENGWHNLTLNTDYKYNENENKYSSIKDIVIEGLFDYQENYIIEIQYQDRLSSYTTSQPILAGIPNHDYGKDVNGNNYFNVNGEYYKNNEKLMQKNIITYGKNNNQTFEANKTSIIALNTINCKTGTKLTTSGSHIVIGKGVTKVLVSGIAWIETWGGYRWLMIYKNEVRVAHSMVRKDSSEVEPWESVIIPPCLVEVSEGDKFSLRIQPTDNEATCKAGNYGSASTYLTVEVVE